MPDSDPDQTKPDIDQLLGQINDQTKRTLHYSRARFLGTWMCVALLAMITSLALWLSINTARDQNETVKVTANEASHKANNAKQSSDDTLAYLQGKQGLPGVPGTDGKDGSPGLPSSTPGPAGPKGASGPAGASGTAGAPGTAGEPGPAGAASTVAGPLGPIGPVGATGLIGAPGTAGAQGQQGEQGEQGAEGIQGVKGEPGAKGETGAAGATGPAGPAGPVGPVGPVGPTGAQGPAGPAQPITTQVITNVSPNDVNSPKDVTATCPTGSVLVSGGYHWTPATPGLTAIANEPDPANGWHVEVERDTFPANSPWQLTVFAICNITPPAPK